MTAFASLGINSENDKETGGEPKLLMASNLPAQKLGEVQ